MSTNIPSKPKDLLATLAEEKNFSKLDLSQAYHHVPLNEESCDNQHTPWAVSLYPAVLLSAYQYEIQFKPSTLYLYHTNQIGHQSDMTVSHITRDHIHFQIKALPLTFSAIGSATKK